MGLTESLTNFFGSKGAQAAGKVGAVGAAIVNPMAAGVPLAVGFGKDAIDATKGKVQPVKQSREMLAADLNTLRTNPNALGLSDAEKEKMRSEAVQTASAQNQAQSSQLAQAALAGQGFQAGAFEAAQQDLGDLAADAAVKAGTSINDLHNRMVESEKARILGELDAARERTRQNTRFWLDKGIQGVGAIISAAMGGGASPLAAVGAAPAAAPAPPPATPAPA